MRVCDVGANEPEWNIHFQQMGDVGGSSGTEIVDADNLVSLGQQALTEVRPQESRTSRDDSSWPTHQGSTPQILR